MIHPHLQPDSKTRLAILRKFKVSPGALIHGGMEAEVYALDTESVLKLYPGTISLTDLISLRDFYASMKAADLSYHLPRIRKVAAQGEYCISIERRLPGTPMSVVLPSLDRAQMDRMMQVYLTAALELSSIRMPPDSQRYKLFDAQKLSQRTGGDWHQFLRRFLDYKLSQVSPYLSRDVIDFPAKVHLMNAVLAQPYTGGYHLVHGDFFPGNILIGSDHKVNALLDFGLFTMFGDPLFDLATGWVFFDMYDELKLSLRERLLSIILQAIGESMRGVLYRYVLLYSILSGNTYSPDCSDGQYLWCVANLNNQAYWDILE